MKTKFNLLGLIGYGFIVLYWIFMTIFGILVCIMRWQEYIATGTTSNSMGLGLLVFTTAGLSSAVILTIFGILFYVSQIILYNKERKLLNEDRNI